MRRQAAHRLQLCMRKAHDHAYPPGKMHACLFFFLLACASNFMPDAPTNKNVVFVRQWGKGVSM